MRPTPRFVALFLAVLSVLALAAPARGSGLLVPSDRNLPPLRITDHLVDVKIHDQVALTTLTQTFRNDTNQRLEATYIFPLPEEADLTNFQMTFNGKMVEGEVLPADEARRIYEAIVRQAKDPGLIEFIGRRLLRMRVFPVEPKSDTTIKVSYQQVCRPLSGMTGYHYPLRTTGTGGRAYGTVRFAIDLDTAKPLKNIWSPTHSVEIVRDGEFKAKIAYEAAGGSLEDDFILLYSTDSADLGLSVIAHKPSEGDAGHFLLMLTPKQLWPDEEYVPQDVVFVIDTSGSMAGEKIKQAREALKYCVEQLKENDRFSIVRFSTGFDVLFEQVAPASKENKNRARAFIDKFQAAGGTNITDTLVHVAGMKANRPEGDDRPYVVVFITDGQGNHTPDQTMEALKKVIDDRGRDARADDWRVFPFGVGHDVNTLLLDRLATTYQGRPVYVQPGENLELVLGDFFGTISQPVLTGLTLTLPDIGVTERFPVTLGDLYHGQQLTIAGKFERAQTGSVKLSAMRAGKRVEFSWPNVAFTSTESAAYVPSIWAGRKIGWILDEIRQHGENEELIKEVIALSQEYGIQTPYTSWLVAPEGRPGQPIPMPRPMDPRRRAEQFERLRDLPVDARPGVPGGGGAPASDSIGRGGSGGGGGFGGAAREGGDRGITLDEAEDAMKQSAGRAATILSEYQQRLRESTSADGARLNQNELATRKIAGRWYNRVGPFLVDADFDARMRTVLVLFASEAYFEFVASRPALKPVFAASRNVVIPVTKSLAVVVVDSRPAEGEKGVEVIESFSEEMREQLGLGNSIVP